MLNVSPSQSESRIPAIIHVHVSHVYAIQLSSEIMIR